MPDKIKYTGFAIAIAWPETYCKQSNSWYDTVTKVIGFSKNHYYKVGHAALVLVDSRNKKCHYFDFGRYHTPYNFGRVRSSLTDHGLTVNTIPEISDNGKEIENYNEILTELQLNKECHGEGRLNASYTQINFQKAFAKASYLVESSPHPYGPFRLSHNNCSRFVNMSISAGNPNWFLKFKLKYFVYFTPTPLNNVNSFGHKAELPKMLKNIAFKPLKIVDKTVLKTTLRSPERHQSLNESVQWISGEGAGSWFDIKELDDNYEVSRFNEEGELECRSIFKIHNGMSLDLNKSYKFDYLSHCSKVFLQQGDSLIELERIA